MSPLSVTLLWLSFAWCEDAGSARLHIEPRTATVGDSLRVEVRLDGLVAGEGRFPVPGDDLGGLMLVEDLGEVGDAGTEGRAYRAVATRAGELEVPPITIEVERDGRTFTLTTEAFPVRIESAVIPDRASQLIDDLEPRRPAVGPGSRWIWVWPALVLGAAVLLARRRSRSTPPSPHLPKPAPAPAIADALRRLIAERDDAPTACVDRHVRLADEVRRFASNAVGQPLHYLTTEEASRRIARAPAGGSLSWVPALLSRADRTKYAGVVPDAESLREEARRALDRVTADGAPG